MGGPRRGVASLVAAAAMVVLAAVGSAAESGDEAAVRDGAALSPEFAQQLFARLAPLREADGCMLARLDTTRFRIAMGWTTPAGVELRAELATATLFGGEARRIGPWALAIPDELARDCPATLAAIERVLGETGAPERPLGLDRTTVAQLNERLLTASLLVLLVGTAVVLVRELRRRRPPAPMVLALVGIWAATLVLQLLLSPRTFLHEYYHVAETISAYLGGSNPPAYGNAGPMLFRLVAALSGRSDDVALIFCTTAVVSSLAIPAVALLDLALFGHWGRALTAAVLLAALPLHLRYAAAEDLFVVLLTFSLWAAALMMSFIHSGRLFDALLAAVALSLTVQTRPEGLFFPAALAALLVLYDPRAWRRLLDWRILLALVVLAALLLPRLLDLAQAMDRAPAAALPDFHRYPRHLVLFDPAVTPPIYLAVLALGAVGTARHRLGILLWVVAVFVGYTLFALSLFDNPPYNLRSQLLPTCLTVLIAAGVAPLWEWFWGDDQRAARLSGGLALAGVAAAQIGLGHSFISERRDQQLQWAFLEQTVPALPERARLLTTVEIGGRRLDAFPDVLLRRSGKRYELVDVRRAAAGEVPWPDADGDLLWYQGMFCYFAFWDEPPPQPMSPPCRAVHERYHLQPVAVTDLDTRGYSAMEYAPPPYRIGFYRLTPRSAAP